MTAKTLFDLRAKTEEEKALVRLLNITAFLVSGCLNEKETAQFEEYYKEAKNEVLRRMYA